VSKHTYYEKLSALAALGEIPASESEVLDSHLRGCSDCRDRAAAYIRLHQDLALTDRASGGREEALIEGSRGRVEQMMWANIALVDNEATVHLAPPQPLPTAVQPERSKSPARVWVFGIATAAVAACAFLFGMRFDRKIHPPIPSNAHVVAQTPVRRSVTTTPAPDPALAKLDAENRELAVTLGTTREEKQEIEKTLAAHDEQLAQAIAVEAGLRQQIDQQSALVKATQSELATRSAALEQAQSTKFTDASTVAGLQFQVRELSDQLHTQNTSLDRERDLLSHNREIRDIIGARNLHIIDVYDTDTGGATKKAFARAFYTEGKSLVYYAYDLPQKKAEEGKFSYVAWGETNGNKASIKKIGLLFHDDQTQRRWSLNFANSQVLAEIDSVFITLERTDEDVAQPKGKRLLTAYLGTPPNHP
jgi:hypothetical protein